MNKNGFTVGDMLPLGLTIVVLGIALALGLTVLDDFRDSQGVSDCSYYYNVSNNVCQKNATGNMTDMGGYGDAYNGTVEGVSGLNNFTSYLPTIALVVIVAVIIGIVVKYLFMR